MNAPRRMPDWRPVAAWLGAALLVLAGLGIAAANETAYRERRIQSLTAQADVLAGTVEPALVFQDPPAAQDAVSALSANREVEAVGVYDSRGQLMAQFVRGGGALQRQAFAVRSRAGARQFSVRVPVRHEGATIGAVYVRTTREPMAAAIGRHGGTALLLMTAVLVVGILQGLLSALARGAAESEVRAADLADLNRELREESARRETAEEALLQSQKMETLGQLTGGIAHDFNNLLQGVHGNLEFIRQRPNDPKVVRWATSALQAAERGARLTAQLLAFSRTQRLEMQALEVREVTERLRELLPSSLGHGVRVEFEVDNGSMTVIADATQLEFALLNLCINARDAMPNGGVIVVGAHARHLADDPELPVGDYVMLSVADTGVGMPQDVQERAFEPFFTTKGVGKGTGLGLAQVYGIAKQAGGLARIRSQAGEGAEVTIYLPRRSQEDMVAQAQAQGQSAPAAPGARVLVVDDDPGVRGYMIELLKGLGYEAIEAEDGQGGLAALEREQVDLLILDYAMPGMTGAEVARASLARWPDLPIVFVSGYAESTALDAAIGDSARLLRKPFDGAALAEAVYNALGARGGSAALP
jgi:signal transduction histidine kinase/ActR/RegA family two-component response regulator